MRCPNKRNKEWVALEAEYGEFLAYKAYIMHNYDIPSVGKARILLDSKTPRKSQAKEYLIDRTISKRLFNGGKETTVNKILLELLKTDTVLYPLTQHLLKLKTNNTNVYLRSLEEIQKLYPTMGYTAEDRGLYDPNLNVIYINSKGRFRNGVGDATVLHEIIHAFTHEFLELNTDSTKEFEKLLNHVRQNLPKNSDTRTLYPTKDKHEFITGIFTNDEFINALKKLPAYNKNRVGQISTWENIKSFFKSLFNIEDKSVEGTLFDDVFNQGSNLIEESNVLSESILNSKERREEDGLFYFPLRDRESEESVFKLVGTEETNYNIHTKFPMQYSNIAKLETGEKRASIRSENYESGYAKFGESWYKIDNVGNGIAKKASEIKDLKALREDAIQTEEIKQKHIQDFFDGTRAMYIYSIKKLDGDIVDKLEKQYTIQNKKEKFAENYTGVTFIDKVLETLTNTKRNLERSLNKSKVPLYGEEWLTIEKEINEIKEEIKQVKLTVNNAVVQGAAERQLNYIKETLSRPDVSATSLRNIADILQSWKGIKELLTEKDKGVSDVLNSLYRELNDKLTEYEEDWNKLATKMMFKIVNQEPGLKVGWEELFGPIDDITNYDLQLHPASDSTSKLVKALDYILKNTAQETNLEYTEFVNKHETIMDNLKSSSVFKRLGWKVFYKLTKSGQLAETLLEDGRKILSLIGEYSDSYFADKAAAKKRGVTAYYQWRRENEALVDIWTLRHGTKEEREHEEAFLKSNFKQEEIDMMVASADDLLKKYEQARQEFENNLDKDITPQHKKQLVQKFEERNSPEHLAKFFKSDQSEERMNQILPTVVNKRDINWEFLYAMPRRTDKKGKDLGHYSEEYKYIQSVPELKAFYDHYRDNYLRYLDYVPNLSDGMDTYSIPAIMKDFWQRVFKDGVWAGWAGLKRELIERFTVEPTKPGDISTVDKQGRIPTIGLSKQEQSTDINSRVTDLDIVLDEFVRMGINFKHKAKIEDNILLGRKVLDNIGEIMRDKGEIVYDFEDKPKTIQNALSYNKKMLDYLTKSLLYGQRKSEDATLGSIDGRKISLTKIGDNILEWTQLKGMALGLMSGATNFLFGEIANHIVAAGGKWFTDSDYRKANRYMVESSIKSITVGQVISSKAKKILGIMSKFDLLHESRESIYTGGKVSGFKIGKETYTLYDSQRKGEFFIQGSMATSMMFFKKVTLNGKEASLYEALDENGNLLEGVSDFTQEDLNRFMLTVKALIVQTHGNYDPGSPIKGKETFFGRALFQYRSWIPQAVQNRFFGETEHELLGTRKGRYRSLFAKDKDGNKVANLDKLIEFMKWLTMNPTAFNQLSDIDKQNMKMNMRELVYIVGIATACAMLTAAAKAEGGDDDYWYLVYLANMGYRVETDLLYFVDPFTFDEMSKNFIPAMGTLNDARKFLSAVYDATVDGKYEYEKGRLKGHSKTGYTFMQNMPILNNIPKNMYYSEGYLKDIPN